MSPRLQTAPPFDEPTPRRAGTLARLARGTAIGALAAITLITPTAAAHGANAAPAQSVSAKAAPAPLRSVALGDSVPSGARCNCTPYVQTATARIAERQGRDADTTSYASGVVTSSVLVRQLQNPQVRNVVGRSELAVVEAGANDFDASTVAQCRNRIRACYGAQLDRLRTNLTWSLKQVYKLQRDARSEVLAVGYWNVFRDGAVGRSLGSNFVVGSDQLTRAVNQVVRQAAAASGALYVDAYTPFKGNGGRDATRYLASDGDHPNGAGHDLLASAVLARLGDEADTI